MSDDIEISGFGPGIPEWANQETQSQILKATTASNKSFSQMVSLLGNIAMWQKISRGEFNRIRNQLSQNQKSSDKVLNKIQRDTADNLKTAQDGKKADSKSLNVLQGLGKLFMEQNSISRQQLLNDKELQKEIRRLKDEGYSEDSANLKAMLGKMGGIAGKVGAAITAVASATAGVNAYIKQQATDRFNLAQELRQSGLAAGLNSSQASLTSFAKTVRQNNFTLGEAADFTQRFSKSVGVLGVNGALDFVNKLAYAGEEGSDLMRRFGMEFGEVRDVAGDYLDTVRNLGMLDRMNDQQLRAGMEDFMSTVISTSNVLKVNMTEAAQMIKETLARDDISALLATMNPQQANTVRDAVGMMGGMGNVFGEAVAMRLAAGDEGTFTMTDSFQRLFGDSITMQVAPLVERLALATEQGGTEALQRELAASQAEMQNIIAQASQNRELIATGDGQELIAGLANLMQNVDDADAGRQPLSADDDAVIRSIDATRQFAMAMEGVNNKFIEVSDLATNLNKITEANVALAETIEKGGTIAADSFGEVVADTAGALQAKATELVSATGDFIIDLASSNERIAKIVDEVVDIRENVNQTIGKMTENTITRDAFKAGEEYQKALADGTVAEITDSKEELLEEIRKVEASGAANAAELGRQLRENFDLFQLETGDVNYNPELLEQQRDGRRKDEEGRHLLEAGGTMETRLQARQRVLQSFMGRPNSALNGLDIQGIIMNATGGEGIQKLVNRQVGIGVEDMALSDGQIEEFANIIRELKENKVMNDESITRLVNAIESQGTGFLGMGGYSESEIAERQALVGAIKELVGELRK